MWWLDLTGIRQAGWVFLVEEYPTIKLRMNVTPHPIPLPKGERGLFPLPWGRGVR